MVWSISNKDIAKKAKIQNFFKIGITLKIRNMF